MQYSQKQEEMMCPIKKISQLTFSASFNTIVVFQIKVCIFYNNIWSFAKIQMPKF
jgi:hypothetical protein